eukprot:SAG25_NODE_12784_length_275_cov_0.630682_1_plen_38_part_10
MRLLDERLMYCCVCSFGPTASETLRFLADLRNAGTTPP